MTDENVKLKIHRENIHICSYMCYYYNITFKDIADKLGMSIHEFQEMTYKCPNKLLFKLVNLLNEMEEN